MEIHRYVLQSSSGLNSKSSKLGHPGFLISHQGGYASVHAWPELGDPSMDELLAMIRRGDHGHPLIQNALHCAEIDAAARRQGRSIFEGVEVPKSHATSTLDFNHVKRLVESGFEAVKVKLGRDLLRESRVLRQIHQSYPDLRWRIDFNHAINTWEEVRSFLSGLGEALCEQIDFLEDPCADVGSLKTQGSSVCELPVAVDRLLQSEHLSGSYRVLKPAADLMEDELNALRGSGVRLVITSYMDHPIGQSYAAWWAAKLRAEGYLMSDCMGLKTHRLFEADPFTEALGDDNPEWIAAEGTGFGFDRVLQNISWEKI